MSAAGAAAWACARVLVVIQVALSVILLVAAGLCVRTLRNAAAIDTGYDAASVLTARMDLGKQRYTEARGLLLQQQLLARLEAHARCRGRRVRGDAAA